LVEKKDPLRLKTDLRCVKGLTFLNLDRSCHYFYVALMGIELILKTIFVGLIDSINQTTLLITIYLLGTHHPVRRTICFILGIIFAYSLSGLLVYLGLGGFFFKIITFPKKFEAILGLIFGAIIFLIPFYKKGRLKEQVYPSLHHPFISLFIGAILTLIQIPITIPFLYLMQQLAHQIPLRDLPFFLITFNLIVTMPLFALLGCYLLFHERAKPFLTWFAGWVRPNFQILLNSGLFLFGFFIILDAISFLFNKPLFPIYRS